MDPLIVVFGLGVGLLVGTTGVGGGSVMTPLLVLVAGVKPVLAIGTDLAYGAITKTVGGWRHWRQGTVYMTLSLWMAAGSIPGALAGVFVLDRLHRTYGKDFDAVVMVMVAVAVFTTGAVVLARAVFMPRASARERPEIEPMQRRHRIAAVLLGLTVGFVIGVTSVGSGALIAVGLILVFRLTPQRVVGTDVFHAAILLWVAGLAHLIAGNVDLTLMTNILIGSIPGIWVGSQLAVRLPQTALRVTLGTVLLASGMGLTAKAGADIPAAALVGVPIALALSGTLAYLLRRRPRAPAPLLPAPERDSGQ